MVSLRRSIFSTGLVIGLTIAVLVGAGALVTITHSNSAAKQQRLVVSSFETIALMRQALLTMQDAEGGQRAFLLSGDVASLEPYERARLRIDTLLRQLEVSAGEGEPARQIMEFRSAASEKLDELATSVAAYQRYGRDAAVGRSQLTEPGNLRSCPAGGRGCSSKAAADAGETACHTALGAGAGRYCRAAGPG